MNKPPYIEVKNSSSLKTIVFIPGLYTDKDNYVNSSSAIKDCRCVFVDLLSYASYCDYSLTMDSLVKDLCKEMDSLKIKSAIFVGNEIGALVVFQIGLVRPDLVSGEILIGISNKQSDKNTVDAQVEALDFARKTNNKSALIDFLAITVLKNESAHLKELKKNWEKISLDALEALLKGLCYKTHFNNIQIQNNKIPNYVIYTEKDKDTPSPDVKKFSESVGTNRGSINFRNTSNNFSIIYDENFSVFLEQFCNEVQGSSENLNQRKIKNADNMFIDIQKMPFRQSAS